MPRAPKPPATPTFGYAQLWTLLDDAFTASCLPETGALTGARRNYVRTWATLLLKALENDFLATGYMTPQETVAALLATAIAVHTRHGKSTSPNLDEKSSGTT